MVSKAFPFAAYLLGVSISNGGKLRSKTLSFPTFSTPQPFSAATRMGSIATRQSVVCVFSSPHIERSKVGRACLNEEHRLRRGFQIKLHSIVVIAEVSANIQQKNSNFVCRIYDGCGG